ncbi:TonB2 energy transduction system inner membrane component ExbB [Kordiimonas sediminis]|uniref:TonB2 energy transduction system inner membrane component ExbB n=1 Tax=Kordiimonas sediminis TaxID=1735581 RepID=A0A919AQG4_9PROT|nr:MotA/TolQ/ExbB proton channel family protein [Kordiimonas sediminis]GHF16910.1 TonB2 energy transduction system inner membrane component ExbB [Kordiimonas sediminis]
MLALNEALIAIQTFMERGGDVLYMILLVTFIMWVLIIERLWYFTLEYKKQRNRVIDAWEARAERKSWYAHKIRTAMISEITDGLEAGVPTIKTLVALCPLIGLLGTVTGMIEVFDVMGSQGSSNARAMAAGVSKATIPTMAGMVAALSGIFLSTYIERRAKRESERLEDSLTMDH